MSDAEMKTYTAHTKEEFNTLLSILPCLVEELHSRDKASDSLFTYLTKIRTGHSHEEIGLLCRVSKATVTRRCDLVRNHLKSVVVPLYLNVERNRQELVAQKSVISRLLFDKDDTETVHIILDGTYIYLQKSSNYKFQKQTYNSHKKRNYFKIMMGVTTSGKIVFTLGPFTANDNDASITTKLLNFNGPEIDIFRPKDVFIVDRGFRDCVVNLMNRGFIVQMPACSHKAQLTTKESNETRLVTKVRYDVERVNGVITDGR